MAGFRQATTRTPQIPVSRAVNGLAQARPRAAEGSQRAVPDHASAGRRY
jgi:hypothetical protein